MKTLPCILLGAACASSFGALANDALARDSLAIANPGARVSPLRYESPFAAYPYGTEPKVGGWREKNDLVRRLGGWAAFAKGQVPDDGEPGKPAAPGADAPKPQPGPHGHGSHGKR